MTTENYKGYTINTQKSRSKLYFALHKEENGRLFIYEDGILYKRVKDAHEAARKLIDENEDKIEWSEIE